MLCTAWDTFRIHIEQCFFPGLCRYIQSHSASSRHIYAYSDINKASLGLLSTCVTLAYSQPCHILSSSIFRTGGLLETLWNVEQAYSEPCHRALLCIQAYSESCAMLAYAKTWHTWNPGIFRTFPWLLHPNVYSGPCHINKNLRTFRSLTYLKPDTYIVKNHLFPKRYVLDLWLGSEFAYLLISTH